MATHWKKLQNPDYLGAYAFDPGEEKIGTIASVAEECVIGADGKSASCTVARFVEPELKPLILNATNCKSIARLHKTPYIEEWTGKRIIMRVQTVRAFGETVDAVRIKPELPKMIICSDCKQEIRPFRDMDAQSMAEYTRNKYGRSLCAKCAGKAANTSP